MLNPDIQNLVGYLIGCFADAFRIGFFMGVFVAAIRIISTK
jgi:hypothetical protein